MQAIFAAYAAAGAGLLFADADEHGTEHDTELFMSKPVFQALLTDLGCSGSEQDSVLNAGVFEVRGVNALAVMCLACLMLAFRRVPSFACLPDVSAGLVCT